MCACKADFRGQESLPIPLLVTGRPGAGDPRREFVCDPWWDIHPLPPDSREACANEAAAEAAAAIEVGGVQTRTGVWVVAAWCAAEAGERWIYGC